MANPHLVDGSLDWSGGVDTGKVVTISSDLNPNGLDRSQTAWLINATCRGGAIQQRTGWQPVGGTGSNTVVIGDGTLLWQGGFIYEPTNGANPYLVCSIGGVLYSVLLESPYTITDLTGGNPALANPAANTKSYFCQAEKWLIVQAGDYSTLPLFWSGAALSRSNGFLGAGNVNNQLPAAGPMDYYEGRVWYAGYPRPRNVGAGDIVGGTHGDDNVLYTTENPVVLGGDAFTVPSNAGSIRALKHAANLNTALGSGQLFIFTRKAVYSLDVPITRDDWIAADADNAPSMKVALLRYGTTSDNSVVPVNEDLFFQTMEPGIRSLAVSQRYFEQWGNTQISSNMDRLLGYNDRSLLAFGSGMEWGNRMYQTALPFQTAAGVAHSALAVLDYDLISSLGEKRAPAWEGVHEGLDFLQLFTADFGGLDRAFSPVVSRDTGEIQLWELTNYDRRENGDNRVTWQVEFPAYTAGQEFKLKELESAEMWLDRIYGTVDYKLDFRPDGDPCWHTWNQWQLCTARDSEEDLVRPVSYPVTTYRESYRSMVAMPKPPAFCAANGQRPVNVGYQFQCRLTITGWCRVRGLLLYMLPLEKTAFQGMVCQSMLVGNITSDTA